MNRILAVLFALMLVLSGCLGGGEAIEEPVENLLDTDGDGIPNIDDEDDDGDSWSDVDELNCDSDSLLASSVPADADGDGICDVRDSDKDGDGWSNIDEEACGSDPGVATSMPADADADGTCDAFDEDADGDSYADGVENQCGSDPLDATSVPADMDGDGTCDALDDDIDGDGVLNDDDFAPEDPDKTEGKGGCMDASALNYDETAEVDDASCFTLEDAEEAMAAAGDGVMSLEWIDESDGMSTQSILIVDEINGKTSITLALLGENNVILYRATYVDDGNGFVQVDLFAMADEEGFPPITEKYKVDSSYYVADDDSESGWSHCEYDGTDWYCADIFDDEDESVYNADSTNQTFHQYQCANGEIVLLSQVNDGTANCADGSDEPDIQSDGSQFICDDGSTIDFYLANDGSEDCADGSDEDNFITQFTCDNGNTIPSSWVNDEYDDCGDGSDEPVYDRSDSETSTYSCEDGSEVALSKVNDGTEDCVDGTDENPSGEIEELFEFPCDGDVSGEEFVSISLVNDGNDDCPDGEDEPTYVGPDETSTFTCYDYWNDEPIETIPLSSVNDGEVDCQFHDDEFVLATENWFGADMDDEAFTGECQVDGEDIGWPWVFVNDGIQDCDGGADEDDGTGNMNYTCEDGTVISFALLNDGSEDCAGGEDEPDYRISTDYTCENGETIPFQWVNDGEADCNDSTDEPTYDQAELTDFECDDGTLIPFSSVNDGEDDCADAEDEVVEEEVSEFTCASGDTIPLSFVNDGEDDCSSGDDEPSYDPVTGSEVSTYACQYSGENIALSLVNNMEYDCEDSTDEPEFEEISTFECVDGSDTIPLSWANDGYEDCDDGSDEAQYEMPEDESVFSCADGSEITVSQFNDGAVDCADGSDEPSTFMCDDGSDEINFGYINDGSEDCDDGSDEAVVEDLNVADCYGSEDGSSLTTSQFHDGSADCETGWDEMDFELAADCEWGGEDVGWLCADVFFPSDAAYEMWMHTDESGVEMIGLNGTMSDGTSMMAMFDATTHAFLMMETTEYDDDGAMMQTLMKSDAYDPTLVDALVVNMTLDTHAPPFAVEFDGEPHSVDDGKVFICDDGEEVPFGYANDGEEDCADGSDEPTYEEEVYTCYALDDGSEVPMSNVNDGEEDCADGTDEPIYDEEGEETSFFTCLYSGEDIILSWVNDGYEDCEDGSDEYEGYSYETSGFECEDGEYEIDLSEVNNGYEDCEDGSDEATVGEGHGYGMYTFFSTGIASWSMDENTSMLEIVFSNCNTFDETSAQFGGEDYLLPSDCGDELARYSMAEIMNGDITGLSMLDDSEPSDTEESYVLYVDEDFELEGWNTVRLSTPDGEYADENPQVQLPAPGIGFALIAMLGAAMFLNRRND